MLHHHPYPKPQPSREQTGGVGLCSNDIALLASMVPWKAIDNTKMPINLSIIDLRDFLHLEQVGKNLEIENLFPGDVSLAAFTLPTLLRFYSFIPIC
jgi:hypothetical protein